MSADRSIPIARLADFSEMTGKTSLERSFAVSKIQQRYVQDVRISVIHREQLFKIFQGSMPSDPKMTRAFSTRKLKPLCHVSPHIHIVNEKYKIKCKINKRTI